MEGGRRGGGRGGRMGGVIRGRVVHYMYVSGVVYDMMVLCIKRGWGTDGGH